jgi:hypothetical protein
MSPNRLKTFLAQNPVGDAPGMESVDVKFLEAVVANTAPAEETASPPMPVPVSVPAIRRINKNLRLPADLVDFIDYVYTPMRRMKQQDAYTQALEAFFRPIMRDQKSAGDITSPVPRDHGNCSQS